MPRTSTEGVEALAKGFGELEAINGGSACRFSRASDLDRRSRGLRGVRGRLGGRRKGAGGTETAVVGVERVDGADDAGGEYAEKPAPCLVHARGIELAIRRERRVAMDD